MEMTEPASTVETEGATIAVDAAGDPVAGPVSSADLVIGPTTAQPPPSDVPAPAGELQANASNPDEEAATEATGAAVTSGPAAVGESTAAALRDELVELREQVAGLRNEFTQKIRYDEVKERQLNDLRTEVQGHRAGLYRKLLGPIITDLIRMYDDLADALAAGIAADEKAAERTLASFQDSVLEALARCGVELRPAAEMLEPDGLPAIVDRSLHQVVRAVTTERADFHGRVARHRKAGFDQDGRVLRPAVVEGYVFRAPVAAPSDNSATSTGSVASPDSGAAAELTPAEPTDPAVLPAASNTGPDDAAAGRSHTTI
jgi:molecular chaperone GrpE (heat shock protein)